MVDVFISYKQEERERIRPIVNGLLALKIDVWSDERLLVGVSFTQEIDRLVRECKAQLVCWSAASVRSDWVRGEAEIGRRRGVLVGAQIERCELSPPFNMLHTADLSGWNGAVGHPGWRMIVDAIGSKLGRPGLGTLIQIQQSTDPEAWKLWAQTYQSDPFTDDAWTRARELQFNVVPKRRPQEFARPHRKESPMPGMGQTVAFPTNGEAIQGYLATPAFGKGPGIIVIQEWWGLVPHIKNVADRFAAEGFSALAPDMYHGQTASEPDAAGKLFIALDIKRAEKDLRGATKYLKDQSSTAKIGVIGFSMGGQLALLAATLDVSIGACVNLYGIHPNVKPDYRKLSGPVLSLYAEKDLFVTPEVARAVEKAIMDAGKSSEILIYPGVDHGFFNDDRLDVHDKPAAADAWQRAVAFFRQHLK